MTSSDRALVQDWTCARCKVTVRWMPGRERREHPPSWIEDGGRFYCLACQRELAAEAGFCGAPADTTTQRRAQLRAWALVEFEIKRDPDRSNSEIAHAVRSSVLAVLKARQRLERRSGQ